MTAVHDAGITSDKLIAGMILSPVVNLIPVLNDNGGQQ
jgi:hypothetical protein